MADKDAEPLPSISGKIKKSLFMENYESVYAAGDQDGDDDYSPCLAMHD